MEDSNLSFLIGLAIAAVVLAWFTLAKAGLRAVTARLGRDATRRDMRKQRRKIDYRQRFDTLFSHEERWEIEQNLRVVFVDEWTKCHDDVAARVAQVGAGGVKRVRGTHHCGQAGVEIEFDDGTRLVATGAEFDSALRLVHESMLGGLTASRVGGDVGRAELDFDGPRGPIRLVARHVAVLA